MTPVRFPGVGKQCGDRRGIAGRNGAGKTTLFRLPAGADATGGETWRHPGIRFTLPRQDRGEASAATVGEAALEPFSELLSTEERVEAMAAEPGWGAGGGVSHRIRNG